MCKAGNDLNVVSTPGTLGRVWSAMNLLDHYYLSMISPFGNFFDHIAGPFPQGTSVYASISLSLIDTLFSGNIPDPTFAVVAEIAWFTTYLPDGTESPQQEGDFGQDILIADNVARIGFRLFAERAWAIAHMNVFSI
jgi:hypothetical protein